MAARGTQSPGVKQLLKAEEEASQLVEEARKRKAQRLKQAKQEAEAEVAAFREQKEREYQEQVSKNETHGQDDTEKIRIDTDEKLKTLKSQVDDNKEEVITKLLEIVRKVKINVHENYIKPDQA